MKNLTTKAAKNYILNKYGYLQHDIKKLVNASRITAKQYNCSPLNMFFFMIENRQIRELNTHSYNFNTALGREIKETFKNTYHE